MDTQPALGENDDSAVMLGDSSQSATTHQFSKKDGAILWHATYQPGRLVGRLYTGWNHM